MYPVVCIGRYEGTHTFPGRSDRPGASLQSVVHPAIAPQYVCGAATSSLGKSRQDTRPIAGAASLNKAGAKATIR